MRYDAVVIGGGHNGLVAAAYLARAGMRTLVCEARHIVGGAAVTEAPWPEAPDIRVTSLSYVVSLLPLSVIRDLGLRDHGYVVHPQGATYVPFPDGSSIALFSGDPGADREQVARFSRKDAETLDRWQAWLDGIAGVLGPLLTQIPPRIGSTKWSDLVDQLKLAWKLRGLGERSLADVVRLMSMSVGDLLDEWFESDAVKAALAVSGIIGTWAGPRAPGTAYVLLHHSIGDVGDGQLGKWGYPEGGMGGVTRAIAAAASGFGAEIRTSSPVARIRTRAARAVGVVLDDGTEIEADVVVATTHPKITFLEQLDRAELPPDFVNDIERWRTRSGTVKINLALAELPDFIADPGVHPRIHGGAMELAHSVSYLEEAFQDALAGRGARRPFSSGVIPTFFDRTLAPEGVHVMSLFTQWVPHTWSEAPRPTELEAYADRVIEGYTELAPNFEGSILHRQVIGPYEMEHEYRLIGGNIFHGELTPDQFFHLRPAPGHADYTTPIEGLYHCGSATHGGGGVTGIPALNCTRRILADKKRGGSRRRRTGAG
jgi:phytoene dehydrogenase-like protein